MRNIKSLVTIILCAVFLGILAHAQPTNVNVSTLVSVAGQTAGDILYAAGSTTLARLAIGSTGQILRSSGTVPAWSTATYPGTFVAGDLPTATATNVLGVITDVAVGQVLVSGGVGVIPGYTTSPSLTKLTLLNGLAAGTGTGTYRAMGVAPGSTSLLSTVTGTASVNYNCVSLGTLPANTITTDGDMLEFEFMFVATAGTSTRTYTLNMGGTCAADATGFTGGYNLTPPFALPTTASVQWKIQGQIIRQSAGNFRATSWYTGVQASATGGAATNTGSLTESGTISLGFAFKDSLSAQNTLVTGSVRFIPKS